MMRYFLFFVAFSTTSMATTIPKLGLNAQRLVDAGNLLDAKKLLENELPKKNLAPVIHWRLAQIAISQKNFKEFRKHVEASEPGLLKNPQVVLNIYNVLPKSEQKWFLTKVELEPTPKSQCPFFEMTERKRRAQVLHLLLENSNNRNSILKELYVSLPETISLDELKKQKGFDKMFADLSLEEFHKRIELLLTFGQNVEAQKTVDSIDQKKLSPKDVCDLKYVEAKILRKNRKYKEARENFDKIAQNCPDEIKIKARFLELTLLRMQNDEGSLPKFSSFASDYKTHTFTDDVLLFMAGILFDKGRTDEAHKVLKQIIDDYPTGDMIERALFLQGISFLKLSQSEKALASFKQLEKISEKDSLNHAAAIYWQARMAIYPKVELKNPKKLTKLVQNQLDGLVKAMFPTVYSWLAQSLLLTMGKKTEFYKFAAKKESVLVKEPFLFIQTIIEQGFNEEALYLLDNVEVDEHDVKKAASLASLYDLLGKPEAGHQKLVRCNKKLAQALEKEIPHIFAKISYPEAFSGEIDQVQKRVDVHRSLIYGIMRQESGFLPESCSWAGAKGLMQLMYASAKSQTKWWNMDNLKEEDLYDPKVNLLLASSLLKDYLQKFPNLAVALCAYNAGPSAAKKWVAKNNGAPLDIFIADIPYKETESYVKAVLGAAAAYVKQPFLPQLSMSVDK